MTIITPINLLNQSKCTFLFKIIVIIIINIMWTFLLLNLNETNYVCGKKLLLTPIPSFSRYLYWFLYYNKNGKVFRPGGHFMYKVSIAQENWVHFHEILDY